MEKNELKSWEKELETSIEKLEEKIHYTDQLTSKGYYDIVEQQNHGKEIGRLKKELAIIQWMIELEEGLRKVSERLEKEGFSISDDKEQKSYPKIREGRIPPVPEGYPYSHIQWEKDYLSHQHQAARYDNWSTKVDREKYYNSIRGD